VFDGPGWSESVPVDLMVRSQVPYTLSTVPDYFCLVWQIAQRDYKFGKGKHSSLTKATYDAVANRFSQSVGQRSWLGSFSPFHCRPKLSPKDW